MNPIVLFLALAASTAAGPATAGQPISESLVECAALFESSNRWFPDRRTTAKGRSLRAASGALLDEAAVAAREEGRREIDAYLARTLAAKQASWDGKGMLHLLTEDGREWFKYCGSLARHRGLDLQAIALAP